MLAFTTRLMLPYLKLAYVPSALAAAHASVYVVCTQWANLDRHKTHYGDTTQG